MLVVFLHFRFFNVHLYLLERFELLLISTHLLLEPEFIPGAFLSNCLSDLLRFWRNHSIHCAVIIVAISNSRVVCNLPLAGDGHLFLIS